MPAPERHFRPVRLEAEFAVRIGEAIEVVRGGEIRLAIDPAVRLEFGQRTPAGFLQRGIDQFARRHGKARMLGAQPLGQRADHLVVVAAFAGRLDQLRPEQDVLAAAGGVEVVVLDEHGGGQDHVGDLGGVGHELLVHADEQIVAGKAALDRLLVGRDRNRIGVLDQQRGDRRAAEQRLRVAGEDRADARLVEHADRRIAQVAAFDQAVVEMEDRAVVVEGAAAFVAARRRSRRRCSSPHAC